MRTVEINAQTKPEIKAYFMEPACLLKDHMKQTIQVTAFQKSQGKSFTKAVGKMVSQFNDCGLEGGGGKNMR
jgi:hypothetical protein